MTWDSPTTAGPVPLVILLAIVFSCILLASIITHGLFDWIKNVCIWWMGRSIIFLAGKSHKFQVPLLTEDGKHFSDKEWKCTNTIGCLNADTLVWEPLSVDDHNGDRFVIIINTSDDNYQLLFFTYFY